jgi:hypothetical protein
MNLPVEITQLQQLFWNYLQDAAQREQSLSAVASFLREVALGIGVPCSVALLLISLAALLYQPRIPRRALWVPLFGIFGSAPKYYSHTRPASFGGIFLKSRHRITTHRRRKS